jgi:hypothetical protein
MTAALRHSPMPPHQRKTPAQPQAERVPSHILVPLLVSLTGLLLWLYLVLCFLRTNASMSGRTEETIRMAADGDLTGKPMEGALSEQGEDMKRIWMR